MDEHEQRLVNERLMGSFPALRTWFDDNRDTFQIWNADLAEHDKDFVWQAIDQIRKGEVERPRGHQELLQKVLKTAKAIAYDRNPVKTSSQYRTIDGQDTFACPTCLDSGLVDVVSPSKRNSESISGGASNRVRLQTCVVSCDCEAGESWRYRKARPLLQFDPCRMCKIDQGTDDEQRQQFDLWRESYRPQNYNHEFDEWGDSK